MAGWLTPQTPDLEVRNSCLTRRVVSFDKGLYSTMSLFTQMYKLVPVTYCWGVTLRWTKHPIQGREAILLDMLHAKETEISFSRLGLWLMCTFTFTLNNKRQFWHKVTVCLFKIVRTIIIATRHTVFQDQKFLDIFPWFFLFLWLFCTF